MNNPLQFVQAMRNPQQFMQQIMNNSQIMQNPMAKNVMSLYQKGDMQGLQKMANNLAKEKGTTVDEVKNSIMQSFGMK